MESLTRFFHEKGFDAQLGYTGNDRQHVLRLHGLNSDRTLSRLLKKDFAAWQGEQNIEDRGTAAFINVSEDLEFQRMGESPARQKRGFINKLKDKSTEISAVAYTAGNVGLVFSALYGQEKGAKKDMVKLGAPICYTMASAFLFLLNRNRPETREINDIWNEISPQLLRDDFVPTQAEEDKLRKQGNAVVGHAVDFMKKHPWEVSGLLNMIGAGAHSASSIMRGNHTEAMAALSTLTAMGITTFVPEKGARNNNLNARAYIPLHESITTGSLSAASENAGVFQPFFDAGHKVLDWIQEKPLRASSFIQLAANTGYGVAALNKQDTDGNRKTDWGLLASSGTYITGNSFQAIASKGNGPSFDDTVTTAARAISKQTDWKTRSPEFVQEHVERIAQALTAQPEISHSQKIIKAGILERLDREDARDTPQEELIDGFIATEKEALKDSPFISPHIVETTVTSDSELVR